MTPKVGAKASSRESGDSLVKLTVKEIYRLWRQGNRPFDELALGQRTLAQQLQQQLAHVVPRDLTSLQRRLHPNTHKGV